MCENLVAVTRQRFCSSQVGRGVWGPRRPTSMLLLGHRWSFPRLQPLLPPVAWILCNPILPPTLPPQPGTQWLPPALAEWREVDSEYVRVCRTRATMWSSIGSLVRTAASVVGWGLSVYSVVSWALPATATMEPLILLPGAHHPAPPKHSPTNILWNVGAKLFSYVL